MLMSIGEVLGFTKKGVALTISKDSEGLWTAIVYTDPSPITRTGVCLREVLQKIEEYVEQNLN